MVGDLEIHNTNTMANQKHRQQANNTKCSYSKKKNRREEANWVNGNQKSSMESSGEPFGVGTVIRGDETKEEPPDEQELLGMQESSTQSQDTAMQEI